MPVRPTSSTSRLMFSQAPAVTEKPTVLSKTKSGRVTKTTAKPAATKKAPAKKAAAKKAAPAPKEKEGNESTAAEEA